MKKKILLISDDIRVFSGVGTMSREIVLGTCNHYDWVQMGGLIKHPDVGKIINMNDSIRKETGIEDAKLTIFPVEGYGNPQILREVLAMENPNAIMIYTDPRFWIWFFHMEHEIRQQIPILYYAVWDNLPYPNWNSTYYASCDLIMAISKQSNNIHKRTLEYLNFKWSEKYEYGSTMCTYIPHGINTKLFYPISELHNEWNNFQEFKKKVFAKINTTPNLVVFYNNRNIHRKRPGDIILAFKSFCDTLPKEESDKCVLLMHTTPVDNDGTDLFSVAENVSRKYKIVFSGGKLEPKQLNYLYNMSDIVINISCAEGWGLSTTEGLMVGKPFIGNVTGGIQDQMRFENENGNWIDFDENFPSNHTGNYQNHGKWCIPVFPKVRTLRGSVPTPYIFEDYVDFTDVADAIKKYYDLPLETKKQWKKNARNWALEEFTSEKMCNRFITDIDEVLNNWKPIQRFGLYKDLNINQKREIGVII